jgi:hypothetical protein
MKPFFPSRSFRVSFHVIALKLAAAMATGFLCVSCGVAVCGSLPGVVAISPTVVTAGGTNFTMTMNGTNFTPSMRVLVNGTDRQFQFVNSSQILLIITGGDIATPGTIHIVVQSGNTHTLFLCGGVVASATLTVTVSTI